MSRWSNQACEPRSLRLTIFKNHMLGHINTYKNKLITHISALQIIHSLPTQKARPTVGPFVMYPFMRESPMTQGLWRVSGFLRPSEQQQEPEQNLPSDSRISGFLGI